MNRRVLTITLAALLATAGTVGVFVYVKGTDSRALAGLQAVTVLVAGQPIPAGTTARDAETAGLVRTDRLPASSVPQGALASVGADLDTLVTSAEIPAGMVVLRAMFVPVADVTSGLAIPDGKIAVTVPVDAAQRVAGVIEAGSRIAVFNTFNVMTGQPGFTPSGDGLQQQYEGNKATRLLLANVEVLSVRSSTEEVAAEVQADVRPAPVMALVTVLVNQAEAERLILGQQTGSLYLALIGTSSSVVPGAGVDLRSIFGS